MVHKDEETFVSDYVSEEEEEDFGVSEFDITATPNDFNIMTIFNFIDSGALKIPGFQRNYVWDMKRASRLLESLIIGIPVPQVYLYEIKKNEFLVIDGQQRLLTIYFFIKGRFPKRDKRPELRTIFDKEGRIPDGVIANDEYFVNFRLKFPKRETNQKNGLEGITYDTLGEHKNSFDLRPLRNIMVKQNDPEGDESVYEIFNRLNSGGVNLKPQEIRSCLYESEFYKIVRELNSYPLWRKLVNLEHSDLFMRDIEMILRAYGMLLSSEYKPPMPKFLNTFSKEAKRFSNDKNKYLKELFESFLIATQGLENIFLNKVTKKFNAALFEAVFVTSLENHVVNNTKLSEKLDAGKIETLSDNQEFKDAAREGTTKSANVSTRLKIARQILNNVQ